MVVYAPPWKRSMKSDPYAFGLGKRDSHGRDKQDTYALGLRKICSLLAKQELINGKNNYDPNFWGLGK